MNWLATPPPDDSPIRVQIRYRASAVSATVHSTDGPLTVAFDEPQRAVTPGQSAVFFEGERVLGGGRIERALVASEGLLKEEGSAAAQMIVKEA